MDIKGIITIIVVTAVVFAGIWGFGAIIKKVPAHVLKYINWGVSAVAFLSGLASYATGDHIFFQIFMVSLVGYFLTISFKSESK